MMTNYEQFCSRGRAKHGPLWVEPKTNAQQREHFGNGIRVEVTSPHGYVRRGYINATTGVRPSLMLVHRRGQHGSWDLLNEHDLVTAIIGKSSKRYPITTNDPLQVAVYTGGIAA